MNTITISPVNMEGRRNLPFRAGDTVRVSVKIEEKGKTRLQAFEGLVLARKHGNEAGATFTVRKVASGVGVERIFPLYSPAIDKIEVTKRSSVRRSKLYYIRDKVVREVRRKLKRTIVTRDSSVNYESKDEEEVVEVLADASIESAPLEEATTKE